MKKLIFLLTSILTAAAFICAVFIIGVFASPSIVYLDAENGSDSNDGTSPDRAFATMEKAIEMLSDVGGTVILCSDYTFDANSVFIEPEHDGEITLSSVDDAKLYLKSNTEYHLSGPTVFSDINIYNEGTVHFVGNFNPVTFDMGVNMQSAKNQSSVKLYGGYMRVDQNSRTDLDSHITIKSGDLFSTVVGFVAQKGTATTTFTGTSYIDIYGGSISKILCASADNHFSGSTKINVMGGNIGTLCTGGNATRRLNGTADIGIYGGEIENLNINNVVGDINLTLDAGSIFDASVKYANITIKNDAADSKLYVLYNSIVYTQSFIDMLTESAFNLELDCTSEGYIKSYIKQGATGDGKSTETPAGSVNDVIPLFADGSEATIYVIGSFNIDGAFCETSHSAAVTIEKYDTDSSLSFSENASYTLGGPLTIRNIDIQSSGSFNINANNNSLTIENSSFSGATVYGGSDSSQDVSLRLLSGTYEKIYMFSDGAVGAKDGSIYISSDANISDISLSRSDVTHKGDVKLEINGKNVDNIDLSGIVGDLTLSYLGGNIKNVMFGAQRPASSVLRYNLRSVGQSSVSKFREKFDVYENINAVFVKQGANGSGVSASDPAGDLQDAYTSYGTEEFTVVLTSPYYITDAYAFPESDALVTVTSIYNGIDYRETNDAKLVLETQSVLLGGDTIFEKMSLEARVDNTRIICGSHNITFGKDIICQKEEGIESFTSIIGGSLHGVSGVEYIISIMSGTWNEYYAGACATDADARSINIRTVIDGGEFIGPVYAGGCGAQSGETTLTINGGVFRAGIFGVANDIDSKKTDETHITIMLNSGTFYNIISPAFREETELYGTYTLTVNGGDFSHVAQIKGSESYSGDMSSTLNIADSIDIYKITEKTCTFSNVDAKKTSDSYIYYHDGYYYYILTDKSCIYISAASNICDIYTAQMRPVFALDSEKTNLKNLSSAEIRYFGESEFGDEYAGWYIYLSCDDGEEKNRRIYVLKSLSGQVMGPYGNPETNQPNVPIFVTNADDDSINGTWCKDLTDITIDGRYYAMWVSEVWESNRRYHTINICSMKDPWTLTGQAGVICSPTEIWEKNGATYTPDSSGNMYPEVVEGPCAVYGYNGETYIIYSGSGDWTVWYALGQLKYNGGDPIDIKSWTKNKEPVFERSETLNGCGNASFTTTSDGKRWILYHAYKGAGTTNGRYAFFEQYNITDANIVIGNGENHPADLSAKYTITLSKRPLVSKISGFGDSFSALSIADHKVTAYGTTTIDLSAVTLFGGVEYKPEIHGLLRFEHRAVGEQGAFVSGLPVESGEYDVYATTYASELYSGMSASFVLTVEFIKPAVTEEQSMSTDASSSEQTELSTDTPDIPTKTPTSITHVIIITCSILASVTAVLIIFFKARNKTADPTAKNKKANNR